MTWVTTKRDLTHLKAAEMHFLRSVTGYTRLDEIRREVIRKELQISGIQDVRSKYKQNWINHLERMDNTRLSNHTLNYKPCGEEIMDTPGKVGNASMPEQVKKPKPWRKMMMTLFNLMGTLINPHFVTSWGLKEHLYCYMKNHKLMPHIQTYSIA
jgi:hypothetical protein